MPLKADARRLLELRCSAGGVNDLVGIGHAGETGLADTGPGILDAQVITDILPFLHIGQALVFKQHLHAMGL